MRTLLENKKLFVVIMVIYSITSFLIAGEIKNKDKPLKGEYTFPLEKKWETDKAGDSLFGLVLELLVSDSEHIYLRDLKNKEYYIFDKDGKYLGKFGTRGEGPGEVKHTGGASLAITGDKVIVIDSDKLLYFSQDGKFIRSVVNNSSTRPPVVFLNENEFISAPQSITASADGNATMKHINLKTGKEKVLTDFALFRGGVVQRGNVRAVAVIPTITPLMVIGKHKDKLYFGMNDKYEVFITDLSGKETGSFSLEREKTTVTLKQKEEVLLALAKGLAPPEVARQVAKMLPNEETYFPAIFSHDGRLYIYKSHFYPGSHQQVDIFSDEGKYLYRAFINLEKGDSLVSGPTFFKDKIYMAVMDEEGEIRVIKYKTKLPR